MANELDGIIYGNEQYDFITNIIKALDDDSVSELSIGDENGNVIVSFEGGHIRTKEFDSHNSGSGSSGYIKTKYSDRDILNVGTGYKFVNGVLTSFDSDNIGYVVLSVKNEMHVLATSTPSSGISGIIIPAVVYLTDKNDFTSIVGTPLYGTSNNSKQSSWKDFDENLTPPEEANYVLIISNVYLSPDNFEISWSDSVEGAIKEINNNISELSSDIDNINSQLGTGHILKVKKSPSTGEYSDIVSAMSAAKSGDTIYMYDGVYEVVGLQYKRDVKIVGIGNVVIKGEMADDTSPSTITQYATIDAYNGCDIENVTITAKNCRYCIHSQTGSGSVPSTYRLLNVTLIHYGNQGAYEYLRDHAGGTISTIFRAISCWGCGLNGGDRIYMDGCKLVGRMRAWSVHNGANQNTASNTTGACIGIMNNCEFVSYGIDNDGSLLDYNDAIHIQSLASNTDDQMIFNNCKASGFLIAQLTNTNVPTIKVFCSGMKNLKLRFSTYGGIGNSMTDLKNLFINNTDWYPIMKDEISYFINRGTVTIPKGYAVKKSYLGGVALMTSSDSASDFLGVALQDMEVGETGDVKISGYILQIYCNGLASATLTDGQDIYVTSSGNFATSGTIKVMVYEDNQNLLIS